MKYCKKKFIRELANRIEENSSDTQKIVYKAIISELNSLIEKIIDLLVDDINAQMIFQELLQTVENIRNHKILHIAEYSYTLALRKLITNTLCIEDFDFSRYIKNIDYLIVYEDEEYFTLSRIYMNNLCSLEKELIKRIEKYKATTLLNDLSKILNKLETFYKYYVFDIFFYEAVRNIEKLDKIRILD